MQKSILTYLRIALGIIVFGIGLGLLCGDNQYAEFYKWYEWIAAFWNTIFFLGFGLYLLDIDY